MRLLGKAPIRFRIPWREEFEDWETRKVKKTCVGGAFRNVSSLV